MTKRFLLMLKCVCAAFLHFPIVLVSGEEHGCEGSLWF